MRKSQTSTSFNRVRGALAKCFNRNQLETTNFNSFQQAPVSGSGPVGRRFEFSRPDFRFDPTAKPELDLAAGYRKKAAALVALPLHARQYCLEVFRFWLYSTSKNFN